MKKYLFTLSALLLLAAPAFGATAEFKTIQKADNFRHKCLNPAEQSTVQFVGLCTATQSSVAIVFDKYQPHPCVKDTPEVCKQTCDPPGPSR